MYFISTQNENSNVLEYKAAANRKVFAELSEACVRDQS